ncbi:hypothetical protein BESB_036150 [Besnoitia besnoiti]|uniref:Pre-rRNA-processing protein TSR2 n=1 Tax=Besnoitia besnoiti TaxID=94643 RepID=A0A2A9MMX6_BESBE|nr:hypothetical protein BESB_036150 [Besnoitia besnoiti]PFH37157.1 hypothetical protein BESB_036150 [Besnoitia besnoiti]
MIAQDKDEVFKRAVSAVLSQWTLLNLAVEHGWGGRGPQRRRQELYEWLLNTFAMGRVNVTWLAGELSVRLEDMFHVIAEDESDVEVSQLLVALYEGTQKGDFSLATKVIEQTNSSSTAASVNATRAQRSGGGGDAGEASSRHSCDASDDDDCTIEDDIAGLMANTSMDAADEEGPPASRTRSKTGGRATGLEVGEDGWVQVARGSRRPPG